MKKLIVKGFELKVDGSEVTFYKDEELTARVHYFNNKEMKDGKVIIRFNNAWGELKDFTGMSLTQEQYQEVIDYIEETKKEIDKYFENLTNLELKELSNGSIVIKNKPEIETLNKKYFYEVSQEWIKTNKKYFTKEIKWEENGMGMMESTTTYDFTKENLEKVEKEIEGYKQTVEYEKKQKDELEKENRYIELKRLAKTLSDEDFEDITGLNKEFIRE